MSVTDLKPLSYPQLSVRRGADRRLRVRLTLIARLRAGELDSQLAAGVSPAASALLATRAQRLTSRRFRKRVAAGLTRALCDAETGTGGFSAAIRPHRHEVLAARAVIATLERRLRDAEPVSVQGVALLEVLLTDGTSPLYRPTEPGALGSRLRAAAAALTPSARADPVRAGQRTLA
jgi:hypothetical protein